LVGEQKGMVVWVCVVIFCSSEWLFDNRLVIAGVALRACLRNTSRISYIVVGSHHGTKNTTVNLVQNMSRPISPIDTGADVGLTVPKMALQSPT
jgi:hypothetical protein